MPQAAQEREVVVILRPLYNTRTCHEIAVPIERNVSLEQFVTTIFERNDFFHSFLETNCPSIAGCC